MKFTVPVLPEQTVEAVAEIVTVGNGTTVTVIDPACGWLQLGVPEVATLTKVNVVEVVYVLVIVAVPAAFSTIVWFGPPVL